MLIFSVDVWERKELESSNLRDYFTGNLAIDKTETIIYLD